MLSDAWRHLPPCRSGVGVETCVTFLLVDPTDLLFLYMFSVFPLFSLSTCTYWTCLLRMCAVVPFHLISPPGCGSYQFKTTANMRLSNGFFFPLYTSPLSLLSVFISPLQAFKGNAWRSLRWLKMHQGWYPMGEIPLMKRKTGHTAVRQITHNSHAHCPECSQTQIVYWPVQFSKGKIHSYIFSITEFDALIHFSAREKKISVMTFVLKLIICTQGE